MNPLHCYYGCVRYHIDELWQCQTCRERYCYDHWHETDLGHCVECVACERVRKNKEDKCLSR